MNPLHIAPNKPLFVSLVDPLNTSNYDFQMECGRFETCQGQILTLPRAAVELLYKLEPQPCEELVIQMHWNGKPRDSRTWTVALSTRSELARAEQEMAQDLAPTLEASIRQVEERKAATAPPTPIRTPAKREPKPETEQPRLFDRRGTGTHGPAPQPEPEKAPLSIPLPAVAIGRPQKPGQIPANIAVKEILAFIAIDPSTANWNDQSRQDLASTILIAAYKAGHIGLWERAQ
jgi:hypothetical protein